MNANGVDHVLKAWPHFLKLIVEGEKQFEVRRDDRGGFVSGQHILLREWSNAYTLKWALVRVTYVLSDPASWGVKEGYAVFGIKLLECGSFLDKGPFADEEAR
jgi:hypothetical protein